MEEGLANDSQLGWWEALTSTSPSLDAELGIDQIMDYGGSWMRMILKTLRVLRIELTIKEFL